MKPLVTRTHTMGVNDAEDGYLSTVDDTALVDVSGLTNVSLMLNQHGDVAVLDLATLTTNVDTVIRAIVPGATPSIAFEDGAGAQAGTITEDVEAGTIVIAFKNGVSTVTDIEALLDTSELVAILTAGTGAHILATTDDEFVSTPLALGTSTFSLLVEKTIDGTNWTLVDTFDQTDLPSGNNVAFEVTLSDGNGRPVLVKQMMVTLSAMVGLNTFSITAAGRPIEGLA